MATTSIDSEPLAFSSDSPPPPKRGANAATRMVEAAYQIADLVSDGQFGYAVVPVNGRREVHRLESTAFRHWLRGLTHRPGHSLPNGASVKEAIETLLGIALVQGKRVTPCIRIAGDENRIYIDLGSPAWNCVEITCDGWKVIPHPKDVYFIRPSDMGELPEPERGGNFDELRKFVNVGSMDDFRLLQVFLLAAHQPKGPYVQLACIGEPGSCKTTNSRVVKSFVDPSTPPKNSTGIVSLARKPSNPDDIFVMAAHARLVTMDNVSTISNELSDALCVLATGGVWKTREFYTNFGEASLDVSAPLVLNGIGNPIRRSDLGERCIVLESTKPSKVIDETDLWRLFEMERPKLLGAMYSALSAALEHRHSVRLPVHPRMVAFVRLGLAAQVALGWKEDFVSVYIENQAKIRMNISQGDPAVEHVIDFVKMKGEWTGQPSVLLRAITPEQGRSREWPASAREMVELLKRNKRVLEQEGVEWDYSPSNRRKIRLRDLAPSAVRLVPTF